MWTKLFIFSAYTMPAFVAAQDSILFTSISLSNVPENELGNYTYNFEFADMISGLIGTCSGTSTSDTARKKLIQGRSPVSLTSIY